MLLIRISLVASVKVKLLASAEREIQFGAPCDLKTFAVVNRLEISRQPLVLFLMPLTALD